MNLGKSEDKDQDEFAGLIDVVKGSEDIIFSCESSSEDERYLALTPTRVIVQYGDRGISEPRSTASINFSQRNEDFQIAVCGDGHSIGLLLSSENFEEFWDRYTEDTPSRYKE